MTRPLLGKIGRTEGVRDILSLLEDPCACFLTHFLIWCCPHEQPQVNIFGMTHNIYVLTHTVQRIEILVRGIYNYEYFCQSNP